MNKVEVNIYGKDYTVVGDQSPERIARMAAHVDSRMKEMGEAVKGAPLSAVAVLSALNIVDEFFDTQEKVEELSRLNEQYEADTQHYVQLWEEAKNSFVDYKKDVQKEMADIREEADRLRGEINAKEKEVEAMMRSREQDKADAENAGAMAAEEAESKYSDLENNYFDLQMENIRLKSELEKLKGNGEGQGSNTYNGY